MKLVLESMPCPAQFDTRLYWWFLSIFFGNFTAKAFLRQKQTQCRCELPAACRGRRPNSAVKLPYLRDVLFLLFAAPTTQRVSAGLWQNPGIVLSFISQVLRFDKLYEEFLRRSRTKKVFQVLYEVAAKWSDIYQEFRSGLTVNSISVHSNFSASKPD